MNNLCIFFHRDIAYLRRSFNKHTYRLLLYPLNFNAINLFLNSFSANHDNYDLPEKKNGPGRQHCSQSVLREAVNSVSNSALIKLIGYIIMPYIYGVRCRKGLIVLSFKYIIQYVKMPHIHLRSCGFMSSIVL